MQPNGQDPMQGMPPYGQPYPPPAQSPMQPWQQYGIPAEQLTPEMQQYILQQQGMMPPQQQMTPEMLAQWQYQYYQMQGMPPFQPGPIPKARKSKAGKKFFGFLVLLAVLGGAGWFFWNNPISSAPSTAVVEAAALGNTYRGDALIVRNETSFEEEGVQSIEYKAHEGSVVKVKDIICNVYSTGYSNKEMLSLQDYRDQIKNYQRTLIQGQAKLDTKMDQMEAEVIQRGLEVRNLVQGARGNLVNQEEILAAAIKQRQDYFRSTNSDDMRLNRLYDDEETQQQRIDSWIRQRHANRDGIVSFYSDGFEKALNLTDFANYGPAEVRSMINGQRPDATTASRGRTGIYRLVREQDYAVLMLIKDNTWNPEEGAIFKLKLEQFTDETVDARIFSFTRANGELLLRLQVKGNVEPVLYMRTCQAELGEHVDCMVVPSSALYTQGGSRGVVVVNGDQQLFVPVNVIEEKNGKAYVSAIQTGVLSAGQSVRLF